MLNASHVCVLQGKKHRIGSCMVLLRRPSWHPRATETLRSTTGEFGRCTSSTSIGTWSTMASPSRRPSCLRGRIRPCDKLGGSTYACIVGRRSSSCTLILIVVKVVRGIRMILMYPFRRRCTRTYSRTVQRGT
jgi:hypothetical protein